MGGALILAAAAGALALLLLAVRLWVVLSPRAPVPRRSLSLLVVAGSGGHTTEILRLLENLSDAYSPRHYIVADTDEMSTHKINSFEQNRADRNPSATFLIKVLYQCIMCIDNLSVITVYPSNYICICLENYFSAPHCSLHFSILVRIWGKLKKSETILSRKETRSVLH
ncbi:hypothetical protein FD754_007044 [Muntiacus muntjak]|uniref:UDP-N-acetylglucosamine transferase subunit ALG14 n=1 Tax=Muntiacus muntjak TaxID=9888 RepID=A0A5N3WQ17_MUNMU|nr:hypothetical protein FD754_007044 [Muntiacus muntjak]